MSRRLTAILVALFAMIVAQPAQAGMLPIFYNPGHVRVEQVAQLPDDPAFTTAQGHVNLGWAYKDYSVYGMPLGYGDAEGFVLYNDDGYYALKPGGMDLLSARIGRDFAADYHFNPLAHLWGWLVVLTVGGALAWRKHILRQDAATVAEAGTLAQDGGGIDAASRERAIAAIEQAAARHSTGPAAGPGTASVPPAPSAPSFGRKGVLPDD